MKKLLIAGAALLCALSLFAQDPYKELGVKLDQYFVALAGEPASVQNAECDFLIESCTDSLVRDYVADRIYKHYLHSKIMGDDAVAVHVAQKWYLSGAVPMASDAELAAAKVYVEFNKSSLIGADAPSIVLFSPDGASVRIPAKDSYSVLYFYDTSCPTCKVETSRLKDLVCSGEYEGLETYAVYVGSSADEWEACRKDFSGVTHLWDPSVSSDWQRLYGVLGTPRMFLVGREGKILGRGLDTPALKALLGKEFSREDYVYGEEAQMEKLEKMFSVYGDTIKTADIMSIADYLAARTFGEGDVDSYKQIFGDILYYLFSQRTEVYRDASIPFIDKYINLPEVWNTDADKAQISSLADMMATLAARTPVGSSLPEITVPGTLRRKPCLFRSGSKDGEFKLEKFGGKPGYVVFYSAGCSACEETLDAVERIVSSNGKARVLLVDMDAVMSSDPRLGELLLDSFDLSVLPFVVEVDKKGIVRHRYVKL